IVALPSAGADPRAVQATWLGGKALECVLPLLWLRWLEGRWPRPAAPTRRGLALGLGSGVIIAAVMLFLYFGVLRPHPLFGRAPAGASCTGAAAPCTGRGCVTWSWTPR